MFTVSIPAIAQQTTIEQIAPAAPYLETEQLITAPPVIEAPEPSARDSRPPTQLSDPSQSSRTTPQLVRPSERQGGTSQLYRGGRTAAAPTPLSRPSEGRTGAIARVEGDDRCDPASSRTRGADCARVIETRSAEFVRPPRELSAEENLMADQRAREQVHSAQGAARRLASNTGNPNDLDEQSIAAVTLRPAQPVQQPAEEKPVDQLTPAMQALVNVITGNPPPE